MPPEAALVAKVLYFCEFIANKWFLPSFSPLKKLHDQPFAHSPSLSKGFLIRSHDKG